MLNRIIRFSLENRLFVAAAAILIGVIGTVRANELPIDVLPDLTRPTVTILTEAHGLVPEDIEQLVTLHIEQSVNGTTGVQRVRSSSGMGLSVVWVEFGWDTDIYRNRQLVQEKLQLAAPQLPPGVVPVLAPITSLMGQIQLIGVRSKGEVQSAEEIRALVDLRIKRRLRSLAGVAQVVSTGGAPRQLQVIVDAGRLRERDVTLQEVAEAIQNANVTGSGAYIVQGPKSPLVSVTGLVETPEDLAAAVVRYEPVRSVLISDIGRVEFGPAALRTGDAGVDGAPGVILAVAKQPGVDTIEVTKRVEAELEAIRPELPPDIELFPGIYRQADFIQRGITNVVDAVRDGALLVVIVLFLFLLNLRTTFITLTAIPLSIAITALVFDLAGISINTMTLGGLAVAIGALVDDAIVDVENVFRRLRENRQLETPRSALAVVYRASSEVRKPIVIGTLIVAAVYVPLFALSGMEGRLFTPIGLTYIVSVLASLVVALTVTPVLCYWLLPNSRAITRVHEGWASRLVKRGAERLIRLSLAHPVGIAAGLGTLLIVSMVMLVGQGTEFLPPFNEGSAQVNINLPPGVSLEKSNELGKRLEKLVKETPGVSGVGRQTGRAEGDEHAHGVESSLVIATIDPSLGLSREEIIGQIRRKIDQQLPGVSSYTEQPLAHMLSHVLSGVTAQVAIKIMGDDLGVLRRTAQEVEAAIATVPGVTDLFVEPQILVERIEVDPRRADLARAGLRASDIAETVELALEGEEVSRVIQGNYAYPIVVRLEAADRRDLESVRGLLIRSPGGTTLTVGDVSDVRPGFVANSVNRENVVRRVVVQHNVQGRSLGEVAADVQTALDPIRERLPAGYTIRLAGQFEAQERATKIVAGLSIVSLLVMFLILYSHFNSANLAIQVLLNIPQAAVGAIAVILLTGQTLSVATLVGFVALGGIASRNGILLIDHYLHLMREEGYGFTNDMIVKAGRDRSIPVLMTALTSGIALMPLVLSPGEPGRELLYPVASVIVGGLVSSTLLDLLFTPGVFSLIGRKAATAKARERVDETELQP